jgi:hypothetical protein
MFDIVTCPAFKASEKLLRVRAAKTFRKILLSFCGYVFFILAGYLSLPFMPRAAKKSTSDITASIVREYPLYIPMWLPWSRETMQSTPFYQLLVLWQVYIFSTKFTRTAPLKNAFGVNFFTGSVLYPAGDDFLRRRLPVVRFHYAHCRMLAAFGKKCAAHQVGIGQKTQADVTESNHETCARR